MKKQEPTRSSTGSGSSDYIKITESMKKKFCLKQFIFSFYHLTRLALSVAIVVLICQTSLKDMKQKAPYIRVQESVQLWSKNVIVDMITVSTYNCPMGYEPYTSAQWEGTKEGCLCVTTLNQYDYVHVLPGECSLKLMNVGCTKIWPQKSIPFVFWKTEKLICVKRISGLNFYTNLSSTLGSGYIKTCAKDTNYQIQSLREEQCPITSVSNDSSRYPLGLPEIGYSFMRQSSYPIVDIKMSEYSFCQEYNRANISPNRFENYGLQEVEISHCQSDGDPRVREIDQTTEKQLFETNQRILNVITNELPAYPRPSTRYVYKLGVVEYPPWSYSCRVSQKYGLPRAKAMLQFNETIEKVETCIALTIVMVAIWGFLYSLVSITRRAVEICSRYRKGILFYPDHIVLKIDTNLLNNKLKPSLFCEALLFVLLLAIAIGESIQIGVQYEYMSGVEEWLRGSFGCMDGATYFQDWVTEAYISTLQNSIRTYLICLLSAVVGMGIDVIFLIWRLNRGDLAKEKIQNIFSSDIQGKNSDQKIDMSEDANDEKEQNRDMNMSEVKISKEYVIDEQDHGSNVFKDRHQTGEIEIGEGSLRDPEAMSRKLRSGANTRLTKRHTLGRTRAVAEVHNQTEQSLVANDVDDDLQFQDVILESPARKEKKLPRNKRRLQSFDFNE